MRLEYQTSLEAPKSDVVRLNHDIDLPSPFIPRKGDLILFRFYRDGTEESEFEYHLEVVRVVLEPIHSTVVVELGIPSYFVADKASIRGWTKWFNKHRHGKDTRS